MLPHERSLVKEMDGKPFSIVAVNSDSSKDELKKILAKEEITWPQFFDGGGTSGPIATAWNVSGWPTIYVIDAKGVIRAKNLRDEALSKEIRALVVETQGGVVATPDK
jgi:hypothetical protein